MSAPASRAPKSFNKLASRAWWLALAIALSHHWFATERRIERVEQISDLPAWSTDSPQRDSNSPTGLEMGQRNLIVPGHHNPSFFWIIEAQKSAAEGSWRLRHIDYDSSPDGRDIRRTSPYRWWLISTGWLYGTLKGENLGYSIERGSLWADPLIFALLLIVGSAYCARYLNAFAALGFSLAAVSIFPLSANFQPGAPDSHSLSWALAVGSLLPLLASLRLENNPSKVRRHFAIAGILGGLGLWNDATSQSPVLLAIFLGAIGYEFFRSRAKERYTPTPAAWRTWGFAGAIITLGASLFEFAPKHLSWSLDSINPIHALICVGFGEALRLLTIWLKEGLNGFRPIDYTLIGVSLLAILSWPIVGIISESGSLLAADFYARELANHPKGGMASSVSAWFARDGNGGAKFATVLPIALVFVGLTQLLLGNMKSESKGRLAFVLATASFAAILAFFELRWWNLFDALALVLIAILFSEMKTGDKTKRIKTFACLLTFLPGILVGFPASNGSDVSNNLTQLEKQSLVGRDFSHWLNQRRSEEAPVALSTPLFSNLLAYYGGIGTIVSSDENYKSGYLTAVRMASANSEQEASILLSSREITHVVLPLWDPMLDHMVRTGMGVAYGKPLPPNAFAVSIREWDYPSWLQPMGYTTPNNMGLAGFELREFALQAEQSPELLLSRLADLFVERGDLQDAQAIREALRGYPRSPVALGAIANIDLLLNDTADLNKTLDTLIPYLSRRSARNLPPDRRISLAWLFTRTQRVDLARDQVSAALDRLDEKTLKALTPYSVIALLALSKSLEIPFPDESLESTALKLIPPEIRQRLTQ
ncbi:hypothetical protein VDG1235_2479 [Verrucomicrobiia bacterium DG1235]|nr:hypothetical protein VDG1235_2479 [Verrucomicrobiae bacterium DG1235]